jgi:hypothetical protein
MNERDELKHTDTVINPAPNTREDALREDEPAGVLDQQPSNLDDDLPGEGDLTHPSPINEPLGKMPGM